MGEYGDKIETIWGKITGTMIYFFSKTGFPISPEVLKKIVPGEPPPPEVEPDWNCEDPTQLTLYDITHFSTLAIALYLEKWLQYDKRAMQTITGFSECGFIPVMGREDGLKVGRFGSYRDNSNDWPTYKMLLHAEKKYNRFLRTRHKQSQKDGYEIGLDIAPVRREKSELVTDVASTKSKSRRKWYSFRELCFMLLLAEKEFPFFDLIITRRVMLETTSSKNKNEALLGNNDLLFDAYMDYFSAIENINNEEDDLLYTIYAMTIRTLEAHFSPSLALSLAIHLKDDNQNSMTSAMHNVSNWLCYDVFASPYFPGVPFLDFFSDVLGFPYITKMSTYADDGKRNEWGRKNILLRNIMANILVFLDRTVYRASCMPSWEEEDYAFAAKFYKTAYPVIENHFTFAIRQMKNTEIWSDEIFNLIRGFYRFWQDSGEIGFIRDSYRRDK